MQDRCGHVRRDWLTFKLCQAEDGLEDFASSILLLKRKDSAVTRRGWRKIVTFERHHFVEIGLFLDGIRVSHGI
jgi:hypothetical protein